MLLWTALPRWDFPRIDGRQGDYFNLLAHGFSKHSLAVDMEVPAALKTAENPWDSAKRPPGSAPADISYYGGKFYLYFGVVPVVLVLWPFQLLTGNDLPLAYAVIFFCLGAWLFLARLWAALLRDHFPRASWLTHVGGLAVLGLGGGLLALARRGSIWEMPIAAGQFFMAAMAWAAYRALRAERPVGWLALTGILLGLAVGSRPTLVVAGSGLGVLVLAIAFRQGREWWRRLAAPACAVGIPLAAIVTALLSYNYARFGRPLEFGLNYQLTAGYEAKATHFSLGFFRYNWAMYFWNSPQWGRDFPFVHPPRVATAVPEGYYGYEFVYGALKISPLIWLSILLPVWFRNREARTQAGAFVAFVAATAVMLTVMLLCFNTAAARYTADFMPWWLLLGLLGWAVVESAAISARGKKWKVVATGAFVVGAGFTCLVAFCASVELHGVFRFLDPEGYATVARLFERPVGWIERVVGRPAGALKLEVIFPEGPSAAEEPLVTTGVSYERCYFFVRRAGPRRVRFGFSQLGRPAVLSDEFEFQPNRTYQLEVASGAFFPPREHPVFAGISDADVSALKDWVVLRVDGQKVMEERYPISDASPGALQVGTDSESGRSFGGRVVMTDRNGMPRLRPWMERGGDIAVTLSWPKAGAATPQPLLVVGRTGNADILSVRRLDATHVAFGYESWSVGFWESAPVSITADQKSYVRLHAGSMLSDSRDSPLAALRESVAIWIDGRPVWWRPIARVVAPPAKVQLGLNAIGSTAVTARFEGRISSWRQLADKQAWHAGAFASVEMLLGGRGEGTEPLVVTGERGRADTLAIEWRPEGRARLIYDHWGSPVLRGAEFPWSDGEAHRVLLELPAFSRLGDSGVGASRTGRLRVTVDDGRVLDADVECYVARAGEVAIARNAAGSTLVNEKLRAVVLDITQGAVGRGAPR